MSWIVLSFCWCHSCVSWTFSSWVMDVWVFWRVWSWVSQSRAMFLFVRLMSLKTLHRGSCCWLSWLSMVTITWFPCSIWGCMSCSWFLIGGMMLVWIPSPWCRFCSIHLSIRVKYCISAGSPGGGIGTGGLAGGAYSGREPAPDCSVDMLCLDAMESGLESGRGRLFQYQALKESEEIDDKGLGRGSECTEEVYANSEAGPTIAVPVFPMFLLATGMYPPIQEWYWIVLFRLVAGGNWGTGRWASESSPDSGNCCCTPLGPTTGSTIVGSSGLGIVSIVTWGCMPLGSGASKLNSMGIPPGIEFHEVRPLCAVGDAIVGISICWGGSGNVVVAAWDGALEARIWSASICAQPENHDTWLACEGCSRCWLSVWLWAHSGVFVWWSDMTRRYEPWDW